MNTVPGLQKRQLKAKLIMPKEFTLDSIVMSPGLAIHLMLDS